MKGIMAANELVLWSGNAHPELAEAVAEELGIELLNGIVDAFPNEESHVQIADNVRERDVFVLQPTGPPANQNIMESLVMIDALRRASVQRITAVLPYFGYARQDRKDTSRVPITAKLITDLYETAGTDRLLAVDLHTAQIQGFTNLDFDHIYAAGTISDTLRREVEQPIVVAPDVGAAKMADHYARRLGNNGLAIITKERLDGRRTRVTGIMGDSVFGRTALLVDDIASTAGSLLKAADLLKERGAERVIAAVTHGELCGDAIERIEASEGLDLLYVTDTLPKRQDSEKIRRITIAPLLAKAIGYIHNGESISSLFD
jgi:ribose-phosphate pyrophosphokinase